MDAQQPLDNGPTVRVRVLGEVIVIDDDGEHAVTRPMLARLLSVFALTPGSWYSADLLYHQITCGEEKVERAKRRARVKDYVWKLRNLSPTLRSAIEQQGQKEDLRYRLNLPPESIDIHRIPQLLDEAEACFQEGEWEQGLFLARQAEGLCGGRDVVALMSCRPDMWPPDCLYPQAQALSIVAKSAHMLKKVAEARRGKRALRDHAERCEDSDIWAKYIETVAAMDGKGPAAAAFGEAREMLLQQGLPPSESFKKLGEWILKLPDTTSSSTAMDSLGPVAHLFPASGPMASSDFIHYAFVEIGEQFQAVVKAIDAAEWEFDAIFGINRGGAILGAMLAKQYRHDVYWPVHVLRDPVRPDRLRASLPGAPRQSFSRILLVDEAYRAGRHSPIAKAALCKRYTGAEVKFAVFVKQFEPEVDPGHPATPPDFFGAESVTAGFTLPWDRT